MVSSARTRGKTAKKKSKKAAPKKAKAQPKTIDRPPRSRNKPGPKPKVIPVKQGLLERLTQDQINFADQLLLGVDSREAFNATINKDGDKPHNAMYRHIKKVAPYMRKIEDFHIRHSACSRIAKLPEALNSITNLMRAGAKEDTILAAAKTLVAYYEKQQERKEDKRVDGKQERIVVVLPPDDTGASGDSELDQ